MTENHLFGAPVPVQTSAIAEAIAPLHAPAAAALVMADMVRADIVAGMPAKQPVAPGRELLQEWRDNCACGCDACISLIEAFGLESSAEVVAEPPKVIDWNVRATAGEAAEALSSNLQLTRELYDACNAFKMDDSDWERVAVAIQNVGRETHWARGEIERLTRERDEYARCLDGGTDCAGEKLRLRSALFTVSTMTIKAFGVYHPPSVLADMITKAAQMAKDVLAEKQHVETPALLTEWEKARDIVAGIVRQTSGDMRVGALHCLHAIGDAMRGTPASPVETSLPLSAIAVVEDQAKDAGLWFIAQTATEAYLQAALRRLHEAVESKTSAECAIAALETK